MVIISIIVPVYKVEKYLKRCVMSLVNQTLKDMEIILVDDGSPDQSGKICDDLSKMDHRIQVIHKKNGGLSSARNAGIKIAQGKYIGFVDSDDDVELNMFECMVEAAEKYNADFLMSDYIRIINDKEKVLVSKSLEEGLYGKKDVIEKIYPNLIMGETVDYGPILSVWNCIYKKKFLDKNKIYGCDIFLENNLKKGYKNIHENDLYHDLLNLPDNFIDFFYADNVMEHIVEDEYQETLKLIVKKMKKGGLLYFIIPNLYNGPDDASKYALKRGEKACCFHFMQRSYKDNINDFYSYGLRVKYDAIYI